MWTDGYKIMRVDQITIRRHLGKISHYIYRRIVHIVRLCRLALLANYQTSVLGDRVKLCSLEAKELILANHSDVKGLNRATPRCKMIKVLSMSLPAKTSCLPGVCQRASILMFRKRCVMDIESK